MITSHQTKSSDRIARLAALLEHLESRPESERKSILVAMRLAGRAGVPSVSGYYRLRRLWLAADHDPAVLADQRAFFSHGKRADFTPAALNFFCRDYLHSSAPKIIDSYKKTLAEARRQEWVVPSLVTVRRALNRRVPVAVQEQLRGGVLIEQFPEVAA
jgi:hypothetical protein